MSDEHDTRQRNVPGGEPGIAEVDEECNITYSDGTTKPCEYRPHYTFAECKPGYGNHGFCPKWNYYHKKKIGTPIHFIADISRHGRGNGIILVGIEEGSRKEDFIRLMQIANKEGYVNVTIRERS